MRIALVQHRALPKHADNVARGLEAVASAFLECTDLP